MIVEVNFKLLKLSFTDLLLGPPGISATPAGFYPNMKTRVIIIEGSLYIPPAAQFKAL